MGLSDHPQALAALPREVATVHMVQQAGWASGPVWAVTEHLSATGARTLDRPACSKSLCPDYANPAAK